MLFDNSEEEKQMWPGIDYSNLRLADYDNVLNYQNSGINRNTQQRMPWHDIALRVIGYPVIDMSRHFI